MLSLPKQTNEGALVHAVAFRWGVCMQNFSPLGIKLRVDKEVTEVGRDKQTLMIWKFTVFVKNLPPLRSGIFMLAYGGYAFLTKYGCLLNFNLKKAILQKSFLSQCNWKVQELFQWCWNTCQRLHWTNWSGFDPKDSCQKPKFYWNQAFLSGF